MGGCELGDRFSFARVLLEVGEYQVPVHQQRIPSSPLLFIPLIEILVCLRVRRAAFLHVGLLERRFLLDFPLLLFLRHWVLPSFDCQRVSRA